MVPVDEYAYACSCQYTLPCLVFSPNMAESSGAGLMACGRTHRLHGLKPQWRRRGDRRLSGLRLRAPRNGGKRGPGGRGRSRTGPAVGAGRQH